MPSVETANYLSITSNLFIIIIKYNIKTLKNDVIYVLVSTVKIVLFTELIHSVFFNVLECFHHLLVFMIFLT